MVACRNQGTVKLFTPKKAIAVDFDNTLWRGTIAEDGVANILPDVAFQRRLLALKERGVILIALSRNNAADIEPIWNDGRMALGKGDFAALAIDWNEKSDNLRRIAAELNLGLDSFVFVDDNPAERAAMCVSCPEVAVAPWPVDLEGYFPVRTVTAEDRTRTALYQAETARRNFAAGRPLDDYLAGLKIVNDIHEMTDDEVPRVAQLSQKTNQFNVCTNRLSEAEVRAFAAEKENVVLTVHSRDRFGDMGLIAFVRIRGGEILDLVMSCRAMNRRIEFAVESEIERFMTARGVSRLDATWRRTAKNAPVAELYERLGFELMESHDEKKSYRKLLKISH